MLMKKIVFVLFLVLFSSIVFSEVYSNVFYYDSLGQAQIKPDVSAGIISDTLLKNAGTAFSLASYQASFAEQYYFENNNTVLLNVPAGRAYRLIKNENEFSPYWVAVNSVSGSEAEFLVGFVPEFSYISSKSRMIVFDCDQGFLSDSALEISEGQSKSCSSEDLFGAQIKITVVSVDSDNRNVSFSIEYSERLKEFPLALNSEENKFTFNFSEKELKLEGLPFYVFNFGEDVYKKIPSLEFSFIPNYKENTDFFGKALILTDDFIVYSWYGSANLVNFSVKPHLIDSLSKPPSKQNVLSRMKKTNQRTLLLYPALKYSEADLSKLDFSLLEMPEEQETNTELIQSGETLLAEVQQGEYKVKVQPKYCIKPGVFDSDCPEWVSEKFVVETQPTQIDLQDTQFDFDSFKFDLVMTSDVFSALNQAGTESIVVDDSGNKIEAEFLSARKGGFAEEYLNELYGMNKWCNFQENTFCSEKENLIVSPVKVSGIADSYKIKILESYLTNAFEEKITENTVVIPENVIKTVIPTEKFKVKVFVGKNNFDLLDSLNWEQIVFVDSAESKSDFTVIEKNEKENSFTVELTKGKKYDFFILFSEKTRLWGYYSRTNKLIDETVSEIDLKDVVFGKSSSVLDKSKTGEKLLFFKNLSRENPAVYENLQVKSVNNKTVTKLKGVPSYYVELPKETQTIEILLENYENDRQAFFSVGETGKVIIPETTKTNFTSIYPNIDGLLEFDFSEIENGKTFSVKSFPLNEQMKITVNNWDGSTLQFFVCQDKTGDSKCDLIGYSSDGKEILGGTFSEPNFEAASIEVRLSSEPEPVLAELDVQIKTLCVKPDEDSCVVPEDIKNKAEDKIREEICKGKSVCNTMGDVINVDAEKINIESIIVEGTVYIYNFKPDKSSVVLSEGKKETVVFEAQVSEKKTTVRTGKQSTECVNAMQDARDFESEINKYAEKYEIDADLIRAIIYAESSFDPEAVGDEGTKKSYGLMQLYEDNLDNWSDIFGLDWKENGTWKNSEKNIEAGTTYFRELEEKFESACDSELNTVLPSTASAKATWKNAITVARYNSSSAGCTSLGKAGDYTAKVLAWFRIFTENYGRKNELGEDYCKPTETKVVSVKPVEEITVIEACETCKTIRECLACVDYKFVSGIFE